MHKSLLLISGSASTAEVVKWGTDSLRVSTHNTVVCKHSDHCDQDDIMTKSKWLMCLLSIEGQVRLAAVKDSSLIQERLAFRENFCSMASLNGVSGTPKLIEEDSGSSSPAVASSSAL